MSRSTALPHALTVNPREAARGGFANLTFRVPTHWSPSPSARAVAGGPDVLTVISPPERPAAPAPCVRASGAGPVASRTLRLVVVLLALLAGQLAVAGPASAHDYLVSTSPASGGVAATSPQQVSLTFNEAVNRRFSTVRVTGPSGGVWQSGAPSVLGATVTQRLLPLGPAGAYQVTWRVVSVDGHPVGGSFAFTLRTAGNGKPAANDAGAPASPSGESSGTSWVPLAAALVVIALLLAAGAAALSRRRASASVGTTDAASPARPRRG